MKSVLLIVALTLITSSSFAKTNNKSLITLSLPNYKTQMKEIQSQGFDVAGINFPKKQVDLIVSSEELSRLKKLGFSILMRQQQTPGTDLDPRYQNPAKVLQTLTQLHEQYPDFTELSSIGKSLLGRDIWAMKITNKKTSLPTKKPVLLINAMHHAREIMTPEIPLDMAQYLLGNYGTDSKVTHWVDNNEIWVVPMLNVDGNNIVWTSDTWWRKNARSNYGVDINRNYPYAWNSCGGSSGYQGAQDYRGPSAGSEPETQTMVNFVSRIKPVFDISFHSYSELVIYPYGCPNSRTPTREVVEGIGSQMANLLPADDPSDGNYTFGTAPELLYAVDGGDIDWMYHEAQVIPYVIEVNSSSQGFQPNYDQWRDKTVLKLRAAWTFLLDRLDGSGLRGILVGENKAPITGSTVKVERQGMQPFSQIYNVNADGTFHLVLTPGVYAVTYSAPGYRTQTSSVTIANSRTDVEVQISK